MPSSASFALVAVATWCTTVTTSAFAQQPPSTGMVHVPGMQHTPGMQHVSAAAQPTQGGQAAFAAIAEIVRLLEADSNTDWSKVDLEALRQHLIDMDAITMRARVKSSVIAGGLVMDITGDAVVSASVRRLIAAHAPMLQSLATWRATATPIAGGMRLSVSAPPGDSAAVSKIRGLGFIGLMTIGEHHSTHHLQIATGVGAPHTHGTP